MRTEVYVIAAYNLFIFYVDSSIVCINMNNKYEITYKSINKNFKNRMIIQSCFINVSTYRISHTQTYF